MPTLSEHLALLDALDHPTGETTAPLASLREEDLKALVERQGLTWNPEAIATSQRLAQIQASRPAPGKWKVRQHAIEEYIHRHHPQARWGFIAMGLLPLWSNWAHIMERGWPELWPPLLILACMPRITTWVLGKDAAEFREQIDRERNLVDALPAAP